MVVVLDRLLDFFDLCCGGVEVALFDLLSMMFPLVVISSSPFPPPLPCFPKSS